MKGKTPKSSFDSPFAPPSSFDSAQDDRVDQDEEVAQEKTQVFEIRFLPLYFPH